MENELKAKFVSELLTDFGKKLHEMCPLADDGELPIKWLNEQPETQELIKCLKYIEVDKKWLSENGFQIAAMILNKI